MTLPCTRPLSLSQIFTEFAQSRNGNFSRMLGKAQAPATRPLNMSYFLCKSNVTQAELNAYIAAVQQQRSAAALRAANSISSVASFFVQNYIRSGLRPASPWSGYWDELPNAAMANELEGMLNQYMANPSVTYDTIDQTMTNDYILRGIIMHVVNTAGNGHQGNQWNAATNAYVSAAADPARAGNSAWEDQFRDSMTVHITDVRNLWGTHSLKEAIDKIEAYLGRLRFDADVAATAKVITDKGGTLPNVP